MQMAGFWIRVKLKYYEFVLIRYKSLQVMNVFLYSVKSDSKCKVNMSHLYFDAGHHQSLNEKNVCLFELHIRS